MQDAHSDVLILGGGLAGLTLAIQLRRSFPKLSVRVLERRAHPVPEATFKVGESLVEIGAHYLDTILDLKTHLDTCQIAKFGLRYFFNDGRDDLDQTTEVGVSRSLPTPTYQLDRGIFENFLASRAIELGAQFIDGAVVRTITPGKDDDDHCVRYSHAGGEHGASARWLIDASGRANLLKRQFDLAEANEHDPNAVWFRMGERMKIDDWSDGATWQARCTPRERWRSTNHLCGPGYWAWLIPLASGSHSIGIVADASMHPLNTINSFEKAMTWLAQHQPQLHRELDARRDLLQDFMFLRHYSHGCKQVFSTQRWALTGEAGVFLDPFYSPGSDFIGISNCYITDLIGRDSRGEGFAHEVHLYEQLYFSFYRNTLTMYQGQYPLFGHAQLMPLKITWDYAYYWGVLCPFFFQQRLTDIALFARLGQTLQACNTLNGEIQFLLRQAALVTPSITTAQMIDQARFPWFVELKRGLTDKLDTGAIEQRVHDNAAMLRTLAAEILAQVRALCAVSLDEFPTLAALSEQPANLLREAA